VAIRSIYGPGEPAPITGVLATIPYIGDGPASKALYAAEKRVQDILEKQTAPAMAKLLEHTEAQRYSHTMPEVLAGLLDQYGGGLEAAIGYARKQGYMTIPSDRWPVDKHGDYVEIGMTLIDAEDQPPFETEPLRVDAVGKDAVYELDEHGAIVQMAKLEAVRTMRIKRPC
jgi:hypothetical protein